MKRPVRKIVVNEGFLDSFHEVVRKIVECRFLQMRIGKIMEIQGNLFMKRSVYKVAINVEFNLDNRYI